jgi:hypothetical protein
LEPLLLLLTWLVAITRAYVLWANCKVPCLGYRYRTSSRLLKNPAIIANSSKCDRLWLTTISSLLEAGGRTSLSIWLKLLNTFNRSWWPTSYCRDLCKTLQPVTTLNSHLCWVLRVTVCFGQMRATP